MKRGKKEMANKRKRKTKGKKKEIRKKGVNEYRQHR